MIVENFVSVIELWINGTRYLWSIYCSSRNTFKNIYQPNLIWESHSCHSRRYVAVACAYFHCYYNNNNNNRLTAFVPGQPL